jgi:hypothetical protein
VDNLLIFRSIASEKKGFLMGIRINQNELRKMEKELKRQIGDLEYKIGRNVSETERNIAAALKKKGINPSRSGVRKIAQEHHS